VTGRGTRPTSRRRSSRSPTRRGPPAPRSDDRGDRPTRTCVDV
jgi:hypothetical protein